MVFCFVFRVHQEVIRFPFLSVANSFYSLTALAGHSLILVVFLGYQNVCISWLASLQKYHFSVVTEHRLTDLCSYTAVIATFSFTMLTAISLLTKSGLSVGRLLALLLSVKYRHIVVLTRVRAIIIFFWPDR